MSKPAKAGASPAGNVFRFTLTGLIVFSLSLMAGAALLTYKLARANPVRLEAYTMDAKDKSATLHSGPWGELLTHEIELERPAEYLTEEVANPQPELWTFHGLKSDDVKALLKMKGLTAAQVAAVVTGTNVTETATDTVLTPSPAFLLSLTSEVRQKLYPALAGMDVNMYLDFPYIFPADAIEHIYLNRRLHPDDVALVKRLVYPNGTAWQLADYQALLCQIPTVKRRVALARALSRQSAVLARLAVHPDTDIDKVAAYWGNVPNVHFTDLRPLLESLKQLPEGGTISVLYLLPKFARDRLYTFPLPPVEGEPTMDCHWTTFNFSSDTPDNRFNDPAYTSQFIQKNFYPIAAPSLYGDVLLLTNERGEVKHSAVYLAAGLVFTKNGNNYRQPWMIMRIPDLVATYPNLPPMKLVYMRRKTE